LDVTGLQSVEDLSVREFCALLDKFSRQMLEIDAETDKAAAPARIRRLVVDGHTFLCMLTDDEEVEAQKMIAAFHASAGVGRELELMTPKLSPTDDHMVLNITGDRLVHDALKWSFNRGPHQLCIMFLKQFLSLTPTRVA
jgi:hypothetical protein